MRSDARIAITAFLAAVAALVIMSVYGCMTGAWAHGIYEQMTKGSACSCTGEECEPVEVVPARCDTSAPASGPSARYCEVGDRAPNAYYLPASGEWVWASSARPSLDGRFHRCTWWPNHYWNGGVWTVRPNNRTLDGKPGTRCFFAPVVGF